MKPRVIGKGLQAKRERILRALAIHVRWLESCERLRPWQPTSFGHTPRPRQTPAEWAAYWEMHDPPRYVSPRERPALAHVYDGIAAMTEEEIKAWVAEDIFTRSGLSPKTQRACAFLATFARKT